jgi:prophage regulatory protein
VFKKSGFLLKNRTTSLESLNTYTNERCSMNFDESQGVAHPAPSTLPAKPGNLLRLPLVERRTGCKKTSIYTGVKAGTFPAPVPLSARAVAWREEDIDRWISERIKAGGQ